MPASLVAMRARLDVKHSVALVLLLASVSAAGALPASYVLLPVSSFASNTSLVVSYNCAPVHAATPCSGHGECYLLLDSAAAASLPYLHASTSAPIAVASSSLDTYNINSDTPLPAAVCICDSGWTGRGDYISHYAMDGDSCGISRAAIKSLNILALVLFILLLLLAIHRLYSGPSGMPQPPHSTKAPPQSAQHHSTTARPTTPCRHCNTPS